MLPLFILTPLAALIVVNLPLGSALRRSAWGAALVLAAAQCAFALAAPAALAPAYGVCEIFRGFNLKADEISRILLVTTGLVCVSALLVARGMIEDERRRSNFASVLLLALIGMNGTVLLSDLFSLYIFLEITAVSSFILIASNREQNALEGAFKYLVLSAVATVLILTGISLLLLVSGETGFEEVRRTLASGRGGLLGKIGVGAFVCGLLIKGGLVPFHGWVPDAYSAAPAPVSVLLAGITTKASGVYALVRLVISVIPASAALNNVLLIAGAASVIVGAFAAMGQSDMKRMLAYSSISQVGYILLGLGCGTVLGFAGAVLHVFNHAIFKSLLFANAAALEKQVGTTDMNRMGGLGPRMPVTGTSAVIGALSTAGVPPLAGFWSKLLIIMALWQTHHPVFTWIAVLMSVVTLAYLLILQRKVFFGRLGEGLAEVREAPAMLVTPEILLAGLTLGAGLVFPLIIGALSAPLNGGW